MSQDSFLIRFIEAIRNRLPEPNKIFYAIFRVMIDVELNIES